MRLPRRRKETKVRNQLHKYIRQMTRMDVERLGRKKGNFFKKKKLKSTHKITLKQPME